MSELLTELLLPNLEEAESHIRQLTGNPDTEMFFRILPHVEGKTNFGPISIMNFWPIIEEEQAKGRSIFVIPNAGGHNADAITSIRTSFIDGDGVPVPEEWEWHLRPDFILQRDPLHFHAYWRVRDISKESFKSIQQRLAAHYGTDKAVCDPSRVMRLAGTTHFKKGIASPGYRISYAL